MPQLSQTTALIGVSGSVVFLDEIIGDGVDMTLRLRCVVILFLLFFFGTAIVGGGTSGSPTSTSGTSYTLIHPSDGRILLVSRGRNTRSSPSSVTTLVSSTS